MKENGLLFQGRSVVGGISWRLTQNDNSLFESGVSIV